MTMKKVLEMKAKREDARLKAMAVLNLALMNFGYRENTSASPTSPQTIIAAPTITFASHRIQPIDVPLPLAKKLTAAEDMPQGHGATYYTAASRIHTTCRLQGLASVPEGWSAAYRLIAADGSVIAETTATDIDLPRRQRRPARNSRVHERRTRNNIRCRMAPGINHRRYIPRIHIRRMRHMAHAKSRRRPLHRLRLRLRPCLRMPPPHHT